MSTVAARPARLGFLEIARAAEAGLLVLFAAALSLSIAASEIAFLTTLALRLGRAALGDRLVLRPRSVAGSALALAVVWLAAGIVSPEPASSVFRVHRLYQVLVLFVVAERADDPGFGLRLWAVYVAGAAVASVIALVEWSPLMGVERMRGLFSTGMTSGNALSMGLVAAGAGVAAREGSANRRLAFGVAAVAIVLGLLATETRSSWLGAVAGLAVVALLHPRRRVAIWILAAALVALALVPKLRHRAASSGNPHERTIQGRLSLWKTGWELFRERPLLGWGLADQSRRIEAHRRPDATSHAGHFHSNLVQVAVSTGVLGLAAYLLFHVAIGIELWRRRRWAISAAALGVWVAFQAAGLFDWSFGDAEVAYAFFFWMGLGLPITKPDGSAGSAAGGGPPR